MHTGPLKEERWLAPQKLETRADNEMKKKIGRNERCPCGSGKKYKACCLQNPQGSASLTEFRAPMRRTKRTVSIRPQFPVDETPMANAQGFSSEIIQLFQLGATKNPDIAGKLEEVATYQRNFEKRYCIASTQVGDETAINTQEPRIVKIFALMGNFQLSYGRRAALCYVDSINLINERRLIPAALCLRAFMETTGAIALYTSKIVDILKEQVSTAEDWQQIMELLFQAIRGGRFDWMEYIFTGEDDLLRQYAKAKSVKDEPVKKLQVQRSTAAFINSLEKWSSRRDPELAGRMKMVYAMLSDICHPSIGGDVLLLSTQRSAADPFFDYYEPTPSDEMTAFFIKNCAVPVLTDCFQVTRMSLETIGGYCNTLYEVSPTPGGGEKVTHINDLLPDFPEEQVD